MLLDILVFLLTISHCTGYTLTTSSDNATVGLDFTFTCVTTETVITFKRDIITVCTITGANTDGTCILPGSPLTDYTYTCNPTTNTYNVTILGSYLTESLHGTAWKCQDPFSGGTSNIKILYVNAPVSSATLLSTPTDTNPVEVVSNRDQTFSCTTNAARPSSRIQWYLSTTNITISASPQPDVCSTDCSDDKVISSSVLTYTGNINDDGKLLYCTAINIEGQEVVRSSNKNIVIWYGPNQVIITPSTQSYTLKETENLNQIQCTADCIPVCTMTWSGPNLPAGTTSVLNLQNVKRNQAGNYQCTATNDVSSKTSVVVNVVVKYDPNTVTITPSTQSYTLKETENLNQIQCTADCIPVCTMTWSGPNLPAGTTSVLNLQNINRNQTGNYQCTASNDVSSKTSIVVNVAVQYAPSKIPSIQQIPQGPIMVDTNVKLICTVTNGNPLAMLSWNCTGTTLSSTVGNTTSQSVLLTVNKTNIMCICSAIHPVSSYRPRVEHIIHAYSIYSKAHIECNASATVIIRCSLTPQGAPVNPVKWLHHFKNRTIRSLRGDISGSDFTLTLPFCNYQDIGSYSCVWNTSYELVHKLVIVSVSGPPIISDQTVVVKGNEVLVSSLFYAVPHPENPIWYAAGNVLPIGKKYRSSTFPTKIMLRLYNEIVDLDGYISTLFIDDFHSIDKGTYTCTIRNPFGSLNVDIDTRETTQSKTEECSSTELSVGVFVGSLVACIIATAAVSTCLQMIICQQIKKSKRLAKERSNQYQDIAMSTTTNVYDTVNE